MTTTPPSSPAPSASPPRRYAATFAARYAAGALLCAAIAAAGAAFSSAWYLVALWPAVALMAIALAYFRLGPRLYMKRAGALAVPARLTLAPALAGAWLWHLHARRRAQPWDQVAPRILLGRRLSAREARAALAEGVVAVLDLTAEFSECAPFRPGGPGAPAYLNVPVLDLTAPSPEDFAAAIAFIRTHASRGKVYVHCALGYSRSASVVAAALIDLALAPDPAAAVAHIRACRPHVVLWESLIASIPLAKKEAAPA